jgi:hypothetical protein
MMADLVSIVGVFAQLATVVAAAGVVVSLRGLRETRQLAATSHLITLIGFLSKTELSEARHRVLHSLKDKPLTAWDQEDRAAAKRVCSSYDLAGLLVKNQVINGAVFITSWGESVRHQYLILKPYLDQPVVSTLTGCEYWADFSWLNDEVLKSRRNQRVLAV